jgi:TusA-related sulfurtransferase
MSVEPEAGAGVVSEPDAVLAWEVTDSAQGTVCALLTPAIKAKLGVMAPGQILEVRVHDLTARDDIAAWCRLSGHELLVLMEDPSGLLRARVRKKQG